MYPNLGATATQYGESYHPILRQISHALLPLEESIRRLIQKLNQVYRDLVSDEDASRVKAASAVDTKVFKWLISSVTSLIIAKLRSEWKIINAAIGNQDTLGPCDYEILHRYSLPYKHFLLKMA